MAARYVVDEEGRRVGMLLDVEEYERMVEELEDLEDIRLYDEAMKDLADGEKPRPLEEVVANIEREHSNERRIG